MGCWPPEVVLGATELMSDIDATIFFPDRVRGDSKMSLSIQLESAWQAPAMRFRHSNTKVRR